jgi:aldehyde dehydrogenase (NAD+)
VQAARACFDGPWSRLAAAERGRLLMALSNKVAEHAGELAALEQRDCGKPTKQAAADAGAGALLRVLRRRLRQAARRHHPLSKRLQRVHLARAARRDGHVIPWNYPMQIFGRSVGGALAAGNCCVVKPAEDACLSLIRVAQLAAEVGFPLGAINIVTGYGHEVGDALARHPGIDHISFTGSPSVGTLIQQVAAERHCPVTLELGGKSPQIVFADADLDAAIPVVINAIVQNAGQTCSAGSRVLIEQAIYEPLLARLASAFQALRVGPAAMDLDLGPLIRASQQQRVWDFLSDAHAAGIATVAEGRVVDEAPESGFYQAPVLLADVPVAHRVAQEEVFGPVLSAMPFRDEDHAVELANATRFGLVAGVWTRDGARQFRMARRVQSGQVFINNYGAGGGWSCPLAATSRRATGARRASRPCTALPRSRPWPCGTAEACRWGRKRLQ